MSSSSISSSVATTGTGSTSYSSTSFSPSLGIQTACDDAQSAISTYSELLFRVSGQYTNSSVLSSVSTSVVQNLALVGDDAFQVNYIQNFSNFPEYNSMCSRLGGLFVSVYTHSAQITSRDSNHLVQSALRNFLDGAWSMLSALNATATDCSMIKSLSNGSNQLQQAFLSLSQYETITQYYPEISFNCKVTITTAGSSSTNDRETDTRTSQKPTYQPSNSYTGSVYITTFSASTAESINRGPLVAVGFLSSLLCLLM